MIQQSFAVGSHLPLTIRLRPMNKIKVYRITVWLEEKTIYYAQHRKVQRQEGVKRFCLARISQPNDAEALLPVVSESHAALHDSPLAPFVMNADSTSDSECRIPAQL